MKRLIVNADDFGMAGPVDLGIIKGHREGVITSASFLSCGVSAEHAAALAGEEPGLGVGVHLCLTIERPVTSPDRLPSMTKGGRLLPCPSAFMSRLALGLIDRAEVELELRAQIERAISLGIRPTHVDGHQHLHAMPGVFPVVVGLAREYKIPAVRFPVGPWGGNTGVFRAVEKFFLETLARSQKGVLDGSGLTRPDRLLGQLCIGKLDTAVLLDIIGRLQEGVNELMCHPGLRDDALAHELGWGGGWEGELTALMDERVKRAIRENGVELVSYSHFA